METSKAISTLCTVVALSLAGGVALAADPAELAAETNAFTAKAASLYDDGVTAFKQGRWSDAHAAFLAAWSLKKHWQIAANLADCELQLGKSRDAAEHAAFYLRHAPPDRRARAQVLFDRASARVATLFVVVPRDGVEIIVDERPVGKSPLEGPVFVAPGHHSLEAHAGASFWSAEVDIALGGRETSNLVLRDTPAATVGTAGPDKRLLIAGSSVAGALAVAGFAFVAVSFRKASDAATKRDELMKAAGPTACTSQGPAPGCDVLAGLLRGRAVFAGAAFGTLLAGGALGLATGIYGLASRGNPPTVQVVPVVNGRDAALTVLGVW